MHISSFDAETIRNDYERIWSATKDDLARGHVQADPIPGEKSSRWGVSAILRPTEEVTATLEEVIRQLSVWTGKEQVLYTRANLHTTISTIELYRAAVPQNDEQVAQYIHILQEIAPRYFPLRIAYQGLTASQIGIIAQGWPLDDHLYRLRQDLHQQLQAHNLAHGPDTRKLRRTAHASLAVFTGAVRNPVALVSLIEQNRETFFGEIAVSSIELVRYERTQHDVTCISLATIR